MGGGGILTMALASVITKEIFELVYAYLHFIGTERKPTYQGPTAFFKIYPL
jgi:hypothetical protein